MIDCFFLFQSKLGLQTLKEHMELMSKKQITNNIKYS